MSTQHSRDSHELARGFDRVERDLLVFSKRVFEIGKDIAYLRASLHELGGFLSLAPIGESELEELRSIIEELKLEGKIADILDPKNTAPLPPPKVS